MNSVFNGLTDAQQESVNNKASVTMRIGDEVFLVSVSAGKENGKLTNPEVKVQLIKTNEKVSPKTDKNIFDKSPQTTNETPKTRVFNQKAPEIVVEKLKNIDGREYEIEATDITSEIKNIKGASKKEIDTKIEEAIGVLYGEELHTKDGRIITIENNRAGEHLTGKANSGKARVTKRIKNTALVMKIRSAIENSVLVNTAEVKMDNYDPTLSEYKKGAEKTLFFRTF
ncbi:MAG: hypothetical protein LBC07_01710, partial [Elusimicrobiota bacterium]|nr:hypothetical protein [Elusimicrobiota bacterium]